jgi:hypothetical protein
MSAGRLVLELQVVRHAPEVAARCGGLEVLSGGAAPSAKGWIGRALGLGGEAFAVKLALRSPDEVRIALANDAIWDSDFVVYPQPGAGLSETIAGDSTRLLEVGVEWALAQMTGKYDWLLAVQDRQHIQTMVAIATTVFGRHGGDLTVVEHTGSMQVAIGSRVFDI